jgi:hypothetical protein
VAAQPDARKSEVGPKDWAYQAVEDFGSRGLVHGYKNAAFLGGRKLTRFEMASLVKRVIESLMEIPVPGKGERVESEAPGTAASRGLGIEPLPTGRPDLRTRSARTAAFREADLGTIRRLADEYSVELAVIGVNLQETMNQVQGLEGRVETIEKTLQDPRGPLQTAISNITRIDKVRFSGYIQARWQGFEEEEERDPDGEDGRDPLVNTFQVRRVRLNVGFRPAQRIAGRFSFDGGGGGGLSTRDAWAAYYFTGNPATGYAVQFGQMNPPFGFEIIQSTGVRESPERSRVVQFFFPDERDRGIKISSPTGKKVFYEVGVFNGMAAPRTGRNNDDRDRDKNLVGRVRTTLFDGKLDVGVSGEIGTHARNFGEDNAKNALGVDFQAFPFPRTVIRGEAIWGRANGSDAWGWYVLAAHNVTEQHQAVIKYDWFATDEIVPGAFPIGSPGSNVTQFQTYGGTASNLSLGWIFSLDRSTRIKFFYEIHGLGRERIGGERFPWHGDIYRVEWVTSF